ncbi:MAG: hypothetical protein JWM21_884 [Acidobacteria bacterium]|nr:hypothetical protein [Acidobacteriota bacterium]
MIVLGPDPTVHPPTLLTPHPRWGVFRAWQLLTLKVLYSMLEEKRYNPV